MPLRGFFVFFVVSLVATSSLVAQDGVPWTPYEVDSAGVSILMPAPRHTIVTSRQGPLTVLEARTERGTFTLSVRNIGPPLEPRNVGPFIDSTAEELVEGTAKFLSQRSVNCAGYRGKQVDYIDAGRRVTSRVFFIKGNLIILDVSVGLGTYGSASVQLAEKYFESLVPLVLGPMDT
jgi:hypothetical protein